MFRSLRDYHQAVLQICLWLTECLIWIHTGAMQTFIQYTRVYAVKLNLMTEIMLHVKMSNIKILVLRSYVLVILRHIRECTI
jgi:hypothetical protein